MALERIYSFTRMKPGTIIFKINKSLDHIGIEKFKIVCEYPCRKGGVITVDSHENVKVILLKDLNAQCDFASCHYYTGAEEEALTYLCEIINKKQTILARVNDSK